MSEQAGISPVDVVVVGAGAAGLATAIFVARRLPGHTIAALDGAQKLGAKILVAGGGRCNVTNAVVRPSDFFGGSANSIRRILTAFTCEDTVSLFAELGVPMHVEEHGKLFPDSNKARTVLDALLSEATGRGVHLLTDHRIHRIETAQDGFALTTDAGVLSARCVVLATGGKSLPKTGSDGGGYELARGLGHTIVTTTPGLVPLVLEGDFHRPLSGVSHPVELTLSAEGRKPVRVQGAMLWTHTGVSGPAVLDVSRHWHRARLENRPTTMSLTFMPGCDFATVEKRLLTLASLQPRVRLHNALSKELPSRIATALLSAVGIDASTAMAHLTKDDRRKLVRALIDWPLKVLDGRGYTHAEVTTGGVPLDEVDSTTMASRVCPGLFLVGEILNVDGRIGGFNFQWAWSTAWVAAEGLAREATQTP